MEKHVVIIGGSVTGLGAGLALARDGHRVTILEKDATPLPASPAEAFQSWDRRGSPQTRHSHAFLARLHNLIKERLPDLYKDLLKHGAEPMRFVDLIEKNFENAELLPEDEEVTLLACRRITFEWVVRHHVLESGRVGFLDGVDVRGLDAAPDAASGLPRVTGVKVRSADGSSETIAADLVLDCSGRRSKLGHWLEAIGAEKLEQDSEPCGIFYSSRFYKLRDGVEAPSMASGIGADLGYMKYGIFPGDDRIFSVTLAASPEDDVLRRVLRENSFEAAAQKIPQVWSWVDPTISEPITPVHGMGDLRNTRRWFVKAGRPLALGLFPIGDALIHTNPITGRGCTLAWIAAFLTSETFAKHPDDALLFARMLDEGIERELVPWYRSSLAQDRDAIEVDAMQRAGEDPFLVNRPDGSVDPKAYMRSMLRDGLLPALKEDLTVLRTFMRMFNLLESPADLMRNPQILLRVLASWNQRHQREPEKLGPTRTEMLEYLRSAA